MSPRTLEDIDKRAVKNFKYHDVQMPSGRFQIIVTTLQGVVVEQIEADSREVAFRHLVEMGYQRIPSFVAFEIDQETVS